MPYSQCYRNTCIYYALCLSLLLSLLLSCTCSLWSESSPPPTSDSGNKPIIIQVGVSDTEQYPFIFAGGTGLSLDLFTQLNAMQSQYTFIHKMYPPARLLREVQSGNVHIASFHNINWGWDANKVNSTRDLLQSNELYVALKVDNRGQDFFSATHNSNTNHAGPKKLSIGVQSFHYRLVDFQTDPKILKDTYNMLMVGTEMRAIQMILMGRGDICIASVPCLNYLKKTQPKLYEKLLLSQNFDSTFARHCLVSKTAPINVDTLNTLLDTLERTGTLREIFQRYGAEPINTHRKK